MYCRDSLKLVLFFILFSCTAKIKIKNQEIYTPAQNNVFISSLNIPKEISNIKLDEKSDALFEIQNNSLYLKDAQQLVTTSPYKIKFEYLLENKKTSQEVEMTFKKNPWYEQGKINPEQVTQVTDHCCQIEFKNQFMPEVTSPIHPANEIVSNCPDAKITLVDNAQGRFLLEKNKLYTPSPNLIDFDMTPSYTLGFNIESKCGIRHAEKKLSLQGYIDEAPTQISLSHLIVNRKLPPFSIIAWVNVEDHDLYDEPKLEIINGGNNAFGIINNKLILMEPNNLISVKENTLPITISAMDGGNSVVRKTFNLELVNDEIVKGFDTTDSFAVEENAPTDTLVADLSKINEFDLEIITPNIPFKIVKNKILVQDSSLLDYEKNKFYGLTLKATHKKNKKTALVNLHVDVTDLYDSPVSDLILPTEYILENAKTGDKVSDIIALDPEVMEHHKYIRHDDQNYFYFNNGTIYLSKDSSLLPEITSLEIESVGLNGDIFKKSFQLMKLKKEPSQIKSLNVKKSTQEFEIAEMSCVPQMECLFKVVEDETQNFFFKGNILAERKKLKEGRYTLKIEAVSNYNQSLIQEITLPLQ